MTDSTTPTLTVMDPETYEAPKKGTKIAYQYSENRVEDTCRVERTGTQKGLPYIVVGNYYMTDVIWPLGSPSGRKPEAIALDF